MEIIDSYAHCGIGKYRPIEDVEQTINEAGVSRAVLVQHLGEYDNSYIERIVERQPERFAGVCLVDHGAPSAADTLHGLVDEGPFRGVRLTSDSLREGPGVWSAAADAGAVIVFFAPEGIAGSVDALRTFLEAHPECRMVVTHLGNPDPRHAPGFDEHRALLELASYRGVYLQISGMEMFVPYPHEELYPLIADAAAAFGPSRLLWGSNYPVVGGTNEYRRELDLLLERRLPVTQEAIPLAAGANARSLWFAA